MLIGRRAHGAWSLSNTLGGVLSGLVGITGPCGVVSGPSAALIGIISGMVYMASKHMLDRACVDDPVDAIAIHAFPGMWGCLASGIFASTTLLNEAGYDYADAGSGAQFGVQLGGFLMIFIWTFLTSALAFLIAKR